MELTVADDFQNNLYQATINSFVSHLADTLSGTEYLTQRQETKIIQLIKKIPLKSSKVLKKFGTLFCIIRPYEHYDSVVFNQYFYEWYWTMLVKYCNCILACQALSR